MRLAGEHDRPDRPASFEFAVRVGGPLQREPGVDPGCQLSAGRRRERLFGVVALSGVGLADEHAQRTGHCQAACGDGLGVQRRPLA